MGLENQPLHAAVNRPEAGPSSVREGLEQQRQTSARLLNELAAALSKSAGSVSERAAAAARRTGQAAHYVQERYLKEAATGLGRFIRRHPASSLLVAVIAGFAVGQAIRRR